MRGPRSIIFYAWAVLTVQAALTIGVIVFVLAGAAYQRTAVRDLHSKVQAVEIGNSAMLTYFFRAQRAVSGYQATGQVTYVRVYHAEQAKFPGAFRQVQRLAWAPLTGYVLAEGRSARAAFAAYAHAIAARHDRAAAARFYGEGAAHAVAVSALGQQLRQRLAAEGDVLAAKGQRTLGVGLGWTGAILAFGLTFPVIAGAVGLRWVSGPLHAATSAVRRRALGDTKARAVPSGPADIRDLATSINFLADEGERVQAAAAERARLLAVVRQASIRIHEHLRAEAIIREAITAIREHLAPASVRVALVAGDGLALAGAGDGAWGQLADLVSVFPPDAIAWTRDVYRHRSSYRVQGFGTAQAGEIPPEISEFMAREGATALLLTPFGAGQELLGCLTLTRTGPGQVWAEPEIEAVEALASDVGQGLEHARLYEGEERLVAELKTVDRAKASFLASASHDLRTPLTSIIGYVEMMADGEAGPVSAPQAKMLDGVARNARRLKTMIEDMLTISKIELGAFTSRLSPVDLTILVPPAVDMIRPAAASGGLTVDVSCPRHGLIVDGDAEQLDRLLVNLLSNAVKYTPRGGRVALALDAADGWATLSVADTGIGIPEEDQASLFTRFFRASNAVEAAIQGSGLGLSIVRTIVDNHHGRLSVTSAVNQGTTVTVRIPVHGGEPAARAREAQAGVGAGAR
jgi:signal transduction histidine kinase